MTSAPIMEMSQTGFSPVHGTAKTGGSAEAAQFSEAMDFAFNGGQTEMADASEIRGSESGSDVKAHAEKNVADATGRKEIRKADEAEKPEAVTEEEAVKELEGKTEEIVEKIAKELEVSPEEVEETLELLGLTVLDLLSQGNMAALVAELKGMQGVELLTDADLFSQVTELTTEVQAEFQQLADSLGMSVEQLEQMLEEQLATTEEMPVTEETPRQVQSADAYAVAGDAKIPAIMDETVAEIVQNDEENADSKAMISSAETADEAEPGDGAIELVQKQSDADNGEFKEFQEESGRSKEGFWQGQLSGQIAVNDLQAVANPAMDNLFAGEFDLQKTQDLINQIADYVRVHHSENVSSMEIQLNPENLGTVNLQVVAKDGMISAQLTAQDEAVRAALESQITQLRESLEAQGLRVDAVEVTAQSHAFEQNLQQQDQNSEQQADRAKKSARRILNLDELNQEEIAEEEMSDADRLQIEMMRMGGNKLNFRV